MTKTRELRLPSLTVNSDAAAYKATNSASQRTYEPQKRAEPAHQPKEISVLIVGLDNEVKGVVRKVLGDVRLDHIELDRQLADLHCIRQIIYNEADRRQYSKHGYDVVIADSSVDPVELNSTVKDLNGQTISYGKIDDALRINLERKTAVKFAENPEQLEELLGKAVKRLAGCRRKKAETPQAIDYKMLMGEYC